MRHLPMLQRGVVHQPRGGGPGGGRRRLRLNAQLLAAEQRGQRQEGEEPGQPALAIRLGAIRRGAMRAKATLALPLADCFCRPEAVEKPCRPPAQGRTGNSGRAANASRCFNEYTRRPLDRGPPDREQKSQLTGLAGQDARLMVPGPRGRRRRRPDLGARNNRTSRGCIGGTFARGVGSRSGRNHGGARWLD